MNLGLINLAYAQEGGEVAEAAAAPPLMGVLPLFAIVFFIFYFLVIRPQDREQRAHQELMESLKTGMHLLTTGGIIGKVVSFDDEVVVLEIANNTRVRFDKGAIVKVIDKVAESSKSGKGKKNGK